MIRKKSSNLKQTAIHCCYHKCMTVYFHNVLKEASKKLNVTFYSSTQGRKVIKSPYFILSDNSRIDLNQFDEYRCTHIIRDPRDLVVSGYFYHLRTDEKWCAKPNQHNTDLPSNVSYQQHLRSLNKEEGIIYELSHVSGRMTEYMHEWDYANPYSLELRYELVLGNEAFWFQKIFEWYGIEKNRRPELVKIAENFSLQSIKNTNKKTVIGHMRPNSSIGQWRMYFTDKIKTIFKEKYGNVLISLGYEKSLEW